MINSTAESQPEATSTRLQPLLEATKATSSSSSRSIGNSSRHRIALASNNRQKITVESSNSRHRITAESHRRLVESQSKATEAGSRESMSKQTVDQPFKRLVSLDADSTDTTRIQHNSNGMIQFCTRNAARINTVKC